MTVPLSHPTSSIVQIELDQRSYDIQIGVDLLGRTETYASLPKAATALIVSNETVAPLYEAALRNALQSHYKGVHLVVLPDGEAHKDWATLNLIFDALLSHGCDRKTVLFALGGGVVGDMTGFAAASFMRGVPFVQVPTTLLAQVDSSVGGKTAINHPLGKNMVGAFYQPQKVICDLSVLKTLPPRELSACEPQALSMAVRRSCEIKAHVVAQDERDLGLRAILNFGHTFGHAIEAGLGYGVWLHGEAVGCGMVMAARLSAQLGWVEESFASRLVDLIERAGLPIQGPVLDAQDNAGRYLDLMRHDKKSVDGDIQFVLIDGPGKARVSAAPQAMVRAVIDRCCA